MASGVELSLAPLFAGFAAEVHPQAQHDLRGLGVLYIGSWPPRDAAESFRRCDRVQTIGRPSEESIQSRERRLTRQVPRRHAGGSGRTAAPAPRRVPVHVLPAANELAA